jgi:hypothetical protein
VEKERVSGRAHIEPRHNAPEIERVVARHDRYWVVVEKTM